MKTFLRYYSKQSEETVVAALFWWLRYLELFRVAHDL